MGRGMQRGAGAQRRRFSLLEVVVAAAILGILVLAAMALTVTLQRGNGVTAGLVDLDQDARRILLDMRRMMRQSGYHYDLSFSSGSNYDMVLSPANVGDVVDLATNGSLTFLIRTDFVSVGTLTAAEQRKAEWRLGMVYSMKPTGHTVPAPGAAIPTYTLTRNTVVDKNGDGFAASQSDPTESFVMPIANGVESLTVTRTSAEQLEIALSLIRTNPDWSTGNPPTPLRVRIRERVRLLNAPIVDQNGAYNEVAGP